MASCEKYNCMWDYDFQPLGKQSSDGTPGKMSHSFFVTLVKLVITKLQCVIEYYPRG